MRDLGIEQFNKQNVKDVRITIDEAIAILEKVGLSTSIGNITFSDNEVRTKLTIQPKASNKVSRDHNSNKLLNDRQLFKRYEGKTIVLGSSTLKLTEYKARNTKYPFIVKGPRGGGYKISREQLLTGIK